MLFKTRTQGHFPAKYHVAELFVAISGYFFDRLLKIRKILCRVVYFCLIYIYIPLFWWNYIHALFFFRCILLLISTCLHFKVMKNTIIGWESNGKKAPILWQKYEYQFPRFFHTPWVLLGFPMLWEMEREIHAFPVWWSIPQDGNLMIKSTHTMEKVLESIFQASPIQGVLLPFPWHWKLMRKHMHFPND